VDSSDANMKKLKIFKHKVLRGPSLVTDSDSHRLASDSGTADTPESNRPRPAHNLGLIALRSDPSPPKAPVSQSFPVDVIAVHGLNGDALKTWTHPTTGKLWLRDFVPDSLPGCRVYSFGYPSKLMELDVRARVQDFGRKLLVSVRDHLESSVRCTSCPSRVLRNQRISLTAGIGKSADYIRVP
jgi:hypothetical protein